ncbi:ShKT domain-containing protein, partial [Haematococcus lacustris]
MVLRKPFLVEDMHPSRGNAVGARYTYMIGVANELADRHIPEVPKRNDTRAGPYGRRADQVGGFFFVHKDDLKRMSKGWLKYTEDVRADDQAYRLSGDVYAIHPGDKPWISEMYGYAFGAAKADVWHDWDGDSMIYPQYEPRAIPKLMHYGLLFEIPGTSYKFDKHWHYGFDVKRCPPWDLAGHSTSAGIFKPPPRPSTLTNRANPTQYYRDLLSIDTAATLNAAFCDYHLEHCSPSQQLYDVCSEALNLYQEVQDAVEELEKEFKCRDWEARCADWVKAGECNNNRDFMEANCAKSCNKCSNLTTEVPRNRPLQALATLAAMKVALAGGATVVAQ